MESLTDTQPINILDGAGGPFTIPAAVIPAVQDGQPPGILAAVPATDVRQQPQQYPQQAPIGGTSGETLILILCIALVFTAWKKTKSIRLPLAAAIIAGVLLAGSVVGPMIKQTSGSAGTQMENMVNGVQNGGTGTAP